ncbi:dienelactone hydrolase family protein [Glaciibacter sp. 2TAF33]|uniref:dienelactone hydrolase family protein n=1 Tax=Glaciibacter sp. 2TAF33 TaxID=3233015 RepID=UPI003F8EE6F6
MGRSIDLDGFTGYLSEPAGVPRGALIVIHEIWGLVDHITDVADRFAAEGYLVLAPDLFSSVGVDAHIGEELQRVMFSTDPEERSAAQPRLREKMAPLQAPEYSVFAVDALKKCVDYLVGQPHVNGRLGVIGFCFGGSYAFALAAADPRVRAAVPFYGSPPERDELGAISAAVLAVYGAKDERLMASLPDLTAAMADAGVDFTTKVYDGAGHAFFNDASPFTYNAPAAADAWTRALEFLERSLGD